MAAPRDKSPARIWLAITLTLVVAILAVVDQVFSPPLDGVLLGALVSLIWFWAGEGIRGLGGTRSD